MLLKDADWIANSVDPDQTDPLGIVRSGSALFAQAYLSENLRPLLLYHTWSVNKYKHLLTLFLGQRIRLDLKPIKYWKFQQLHITHNQSLVFLHSYTIAHYGLTIIVLPIKFLAEILS